MVESKPSAKPLGFYTKENAAFNVLQNTAITGALGGVTGKVVSVLRASPIQPAIAAYRMVKGWSAFSFGFFAIREYIMQPLTAPVWPMCQQLGHAENIAPSFFSGAVMGMFSALWLRRPVVPGIFTMSGICTAIQLVFNEFKLGLLRFMDESGTIEDESANQPSSSLPARQTLMSEHSEPTTSKPTLYEQAQLAMKKYSPIQSISDDEYRARLLERQREIDAQLRLIEEELYERRRAMSIA